MKKLQKFLSLILVFSVLMSLMAFSAGAVGISKDKTADWHDDSQTIADVTLSVPGEHTQLGVDIIYIMGAFLAADQVESDLMINSLMDTFAEIIATGTPVNFGVVPFSTNDQAVMELTTFATAEDLAGLPAKLSKAIEDAAVVYGGENMENALLTAKRMLSGSTLKDHPERQHIVLVATGHTYFFNAGEKNDTFATVPVNLTDNNGNALNKLFWTFRAWMQARHKITGSYPVPKAYYGEGKNGWSDYWADIQKWAAADIEAGDKVTYILKEDYGTFYNKNASLRDSTYKAYYGYIGDASAEQIANSVVIKPGTSVTNSSVQHAILYERAMYEAYQCFRGMQAEGINCYAIYKEMKPLYTNGYVSSENPWTTDYIGHCFMNELAGGEAVNYSNAKDKSFFDPIKKEILYTCGAGSYVEDYIGYENNANDGYNFDFMVDGKITLTVGTTEYTTAKLDVPNGDATASYTFTAPGAETATFTLDYFEGNLKETEKFIWTFGEDIQNFAPASLNYQVELVECRMPEGTAAAGYIVETNQNATLYPVDGEAEAFPVPELTVLPMYTVKYEYVGVIPENVPALPETKEYLAGVNVNVAKLPALAGYTFFGWQNPHTDATAFQMPAHDITLTGYWLPVNDFIDPPIGIKTDVEKGEYQYDVSISVPGDGEAVKIHDEVILVLDGSYSVDKEWPKMKENIIQIGEKVLGGAGRTQMTIIAFGMGDNIFAEGIKTVDELKVKLDNMPLPGNLLFGRSSTNCEVGFTGAMKYIESKKNELSKVDVIYISDFGVNTDETESVFHFAQSPWKKTFGQAGSLVGALEVEIEMMQYYKDEINASAAFTEVFGENVDLAALMAELDTIVLTRHRSWNIPTSVNEESALYAKVVAWAEKVYADVFNEAGLNVNDKYPISVVERAFVTYDNEHSTHIQEAFYNVTMGRGYSDMYTRSDAAGEKLAAMELVNELYLIRYANHSRGWWAKEVTGAQYYSAASVADLSSVITPLASTLSQTNYTNVVITDYMSKWVILDPSSIYIKNDTTGEIIWTVADGWMEGIDPLTSKTPVIVEVVENNQYIADDGETAETNVNGVLYKLTWNVKDDCLLRADNYSLHYTVTVDIDEPGFVAGKEYPANGHTYVDYEIGGHNPIDVPNVTTPAYTVTYLNGEIVLQETNAHLTGDNIPTCGEPASYVSGDYTFTFSHWSLRSGTEGDNKTVGTTDLVYVAVFTSTPNETEEEEIPDESTPLTPAPSEDEEEIEDEKVPLTPNPNESPKTGDSTVLICAVIGVLASAALAVLVLTKKRNFIA